MENLAKLITSVATLVWPIVIGTFIFYIRAEAKSAVGQLSDLFRRIKRGKFAGFEFTLDEIADEVSSDGKGVITAHQVNLASQFEFSSMSDGAEIYIRELDRLCLEYDNIRRVMPPSSDRTKEQTKILVKMRVLAPATSSRIDVYKSSGSTGSKLAAVAMMQMKPQFADLPWLLERFKDNVPFVFYHAALALCNVANDDLKQYEVLATAHKAREIVMAASARPDQDTVDVLDSIIGTNN